MTHLPPNEQTPPTEDPRDDPPPEEAPQREALSEKSLLKRGEEEVQEIIEEVARETEPRWRMLRRGRFWLAIYLIVLLLVLLLALAAHLFSVLPGDLPLTREFQEERNPILFNVMYYVSYIGFFWPATIITVVVVLALAVVRLRLEACLVVVSLLGDAVDGAIKLIVARQRPSANLVIVVQHLSDFSFPSGHTVHYTVFYGFLAFLLFTNFRASWGRNLLIGVCVALVVLVGPSRVYLGEHWPTDVLGGYLIGGLCLAPLIAGYLWVKARYDLTRRPPWLKRRANGGPGSAP